MTFNHKFINNKDCLLGNKFIVVTMAAWQMYGWLSIPDFGLCYTMFSLALYLV